MTAAALRRPVGRAPVCRARRTAARRPLPPGPCPPRAAFAIWSVQPRGRLRAADIAPRRPSGRTPALRAWLGVCRRTPGGASPPPAPRRPVQLSGRWMAAAAATRPVPPRGRQRAADIAPRPPSERAPALRARLRVCRPTPGGASPRPAPRRPVQLSGRWMTAAAATRPARPRVRPPIADSAPRAHSALSPKLPASHDPASAPLRGSGSCPDPASPPARMEFHPHRRVRARRPSAPCDGSRRVS